MDSKIHMAITKDLEQAKRWAWELSSLWAGCDLRLPQAPGEALSPFLEAGRAKARARYWRHLALKDTAPTDFGLTCHPGYEGPRSCQNG